MKRCKMFAALLLSAIVMASVCTGCGGENGQSGSLSLKEESGSITLESDKIRLALNRSTGSIRELYNKERDLWFTKDSVDPDLAAIRLSVLQNYTEQFLNPESFHCSIEENSGERKSLRLEWGFSTGHTAVGNIILERGADEVKFRIRVTNNSETCPVFGVEYPVVNEISSLKAKETDRFLSPFASGYVFHDPIDHFNGDYSGIGRTDGFYPSGWEYPMQFQAYYSEGNGGFYMQTRDGGSTLKSFTFVGDGDRLRASVWHFADDIGGADPEFGYDTVISNLREGNWFEAAEKYRDWSIRQTWCTARGKNEARTDKNVTLYEDTALANFCFLNDASAEPAYRLMKEHIDGKYLFITLSGTTIGGGNADEKVYQAWEANAKTTAFYDMMEEYGDIRAMFEFPLFYRDIDYNTDRTFIENGIKGLGLRNAMYYNWDETYYEICPSCREWTLTQLSKDMIYTEQAGFEGIYHDVGFAAGYPKQCFDRSHAHGSRVNIVADGLKDMKTFADQMAKSGGFYGQELIHEQAIPYLDFYQTRANAGALSQMEAMRILGLVLDGSAEKVHLFEYVYHEYAGIRLDGYMIPERSMGGAYYHTVAFTQLNGGIAEYNFENTLQSSRGYPTADRYDSEMLSFMGKMAQARLTYGKEFLVYGEMARTPEIGSGKSQYDYKVYRMDYSNVRGADYSGTTSVDDVVVTAFRHGGKIAIFLCNITEKDIETDFALDARTLYGIDAGTIACLVGGKTSSLAGIIDGRAQISLTLPSREVVMLTIEQ